MAKPLRPRARRKLPPPARRAGIEAATPPARGVAAAGAQAGPRRGGCDLVDLAGRQGRAGKRHRAGAQAQAGDATQAEAAISDPVASKLAEWIILRSDDNGASVERYRAFISANPSWPSQTFLRRRLEAALWDDHRDDATVWSWFENESPLSAKGRSRWRGDDRARRPRQCRAPGARRLAQRFDVGGHRNARSICSARC
jgi:hypothetical protein